MMEPSGHCGEMFELAFGYHVAVHTCLGVPRLNCSGSFEHCVYPFAVPLWQSVPLPELHAPVTT
eukprot:CAMPEP_0196715960 /NCGR_PEP_ID=MMETSP1090-20130531/76473_1 /TAXON_ID=37098 /ORGANISM="Isochrysis sp, Strain CCMP1244" /LENGTH=63 /DNA_ID=CAMNT_0042056065 /DNA_START=1131 /DNA_END=1322 /DNA_ORIENTATION=-